MEPLTDAGTQLSPMQSEIGELQRVLVHRPGRELERITPSNRAELLFEDILWVERAQEEHDAFTEVLQDRGVHVEELQTLLGEALDVPAARAQVLRSTLRAATLGPRLEYEVGAWLESLPGDELAAWCIGGVAFADLPFASSSFTAYTAGSDDLVIPPLPNSYYTRDPSTWVGPGVVLSAMAHRVRRREVLHLEMIYRHHPRFLASSPGESDTGPVIFGEDRPGTAGVEGGDLLALAPGVLVAACGGRTRSGTVEALAAELFAAGAAHEVLAVQLPGRGGEVHLDTVFSQIDHDAFVVYADLVERLPTYALRPGRNGRIEVDHEEHLFSAVARVLGLEALRLYDTGDDALSSEREQWSGGSNVLALAPGVVVAYERNVRSIARLREAGVEVLPVPGSELGRGRGGPRCMCCPLARMAP